ncbi:unnamed protein product [Ilex paraguariensis]|uniref:LETM1-like protein n=1 Tax=Ilex paraguariensis TaxID=185542 RepID=A0ABC8SRM1_9AQUA
MATPNSFVDEDPMNNQEKSLEEEDFLQQNTKKVKESHISLTEEVMMLDPNVDQARSPFEGLDLEANRSLCEGTEDANNTSSPRQPLPLCILTLKHAPNHHRFFPPFSRNSLLASQTPPIFPTNHRKLLRLFSLSSMSVKLHHQSCISSSSSKPWLSRKSISIHILNRTAFVLDHLWYKQGNIRKRCRKRVSLLEVGDLRLSCRLVDFRKPCLAFQKSRRIGHLLPFASADDGVTVNRTSKASTPNPVDEMRIKLDETLEGEDYSNGLVQSLHDAARVFELAIKEQSSLSKMSWFSTVWLGVDKNAWLKALSYQASVYSILQAASEISSRGDGRDRDINVFVQKSLLRQSAPLESVIREKLSAKQPEAYDWFWSEQVPAVVTSFVNHFEKDQRFAAATAVCGKGVSLSSGNASDISLLMLALSCIAAITKLGPTKVYCAQFFSMIPDVTGRLMDMLVEFIPIRQAYHSIKDIGLRREFLVHFGPRAAACRVKNDQGIEVIFWVGLLQKQLQQAIDRERIWSRLTTCESIEVSAGSFSIVQF